MTGGDAALGDHAALCDLLREVWDVAEVRVVGATPLSAGASRLTWSLDVEADGRPVPLVLQRERPGGMGASRADVEAALLSAARQAGVPVPMVVAADATGQVLGSAFLLTERIEGETIGRRILRDEALAGARATFAADCGRILAAVHKMPAGRVPGLAAGDELAGLVDALDSVGEPHPAFELAIQWLGDHRPPATSAAVVHGDFRTGNLIMGPDGVRAVLDWELAHLGAPMEDLGWLCVRAWRFGSALPVGGMGTRESLFAAYAEASGRDVDEAAVFWWEVFGTLKWGVICARQARTHLDGHARSVELAVLGRRVAENEYDLLRMLP